MTDGYIYCFSNQSMPGILKIGMTQRTPEERVKELFTTGVALPFNIEFAKKVNNIKDKEISLHKLLEKYSVRVNPDREFFRVSADEVYKFFDLMDGTMWVESQNDEISQGSTSSRRDMTKYFTNGQRIRHIIGKNTTAYNWTGIFDYSRNVIIYDGESYKSMSAFALKHHHYYDPTRQTANGWAECEYEIGDAWISTSSITIT